MSDREDSRFPPASQEAGDEIFRGIADLPTLQIALTLASRGLPLFPCEPGSKKPATSHGFKDATTDIRHYDHPRLKGHVQGVGLDGNERFLADSRDNWAFEPGSVGLLIVDIDPKNGGNETWAALEAAHGKIHTLKVLTPSGGRHLYFRGTVPQVNKKLGPGIDTRCFGGYVLLPPSRVILEVDGTKRIGVYTWDDPTAPIARLPAWVVEEIEAQIEAVAVGAGQTAFENWRAEGGTAFENWRAEGGEGGRFDFLLSLIGDHDGGQGFYDPMVRAAGMGVALGMAADAILDRLRAAALTADRCNHSLAEIQDRLSKMPGAIRSFQAKDTRRRLAEEQEDDKPFEPDPEIAALPAEQAAGTATFNKPLGEVAEEHGPFPDAAPAYEPQEPTAEAKEQTTAPAWNSIKEAEAKLKATAKEFYCEEGARHRLIRGTPGAGKTEQYHRASELRYPSPEDDVPPDLDELLNEDLSQFSNDLAEELTEILNEDPSRRSKKPKPKRDATITFVPDHKMADQYATDLGRKGLENLVIRGRTHGPNPLCQRASEVREAERLGLPIMSTMCRRTLPNGDVSQCPHYHNCPYLAQMQKARDVPRIIVPHATAGLPWESRDPDGRFLHPSQFARAVVDEDITFTFLEKSTVNLQALRATEPGPDIIAATAAPEGVLSYLRGKGYTGQNLARFAGQQADAERDAQLIVKPSDDPATVKAALRQFKPPPALAIVFERLASELETGRTGHSKTLFWERTKNGDERLVTQGRKKLWDTTGQRVELLDGTADPGLLRFLFPGLEAPEPILIRRNLYTVQVSDRTFSRHSLLVHENAPLLRYEVEQFLRRLSSSGRKVLVITYKELRARWTGENADCSTLPVSAPAFGCDITHFGRYRGNNDFTEHDTVVVIGRNELDVRTAEKLAMALTYDDPVEIQRLEPDPTGAIRYPKVERPYLMRNGSDQKTEVSVHPDPIVQAVVEQKREMEILQGIDRPRPIRSAKTKELFLLCNIPITTIEVDRLLPWHMIAGNRKLNVLIGMLGPRARRVMPLCSHWLSKVAPEIWATSEDAKWWLELAKNEQLADIVTGFETLVFRDEAVSPNSILLAKTASWAPYQGLKLIRFKTPRSKHESRALVAHGLDEDQIRAGLAKCLGLPAEKVVIVSPRPSASTSDQPSAAREAASPTTGDALLDQTLAWCAAQTVALPLSPKPLAALPGSPWKTAKAVKIGRPAPRWSRSWRADRQKVGARRNTD